MEMGNQPLASCSVEQPRPLGGSVAAHEASVAAEATCGTWVRGGRCGAGNPVPERGCPGLGAGSYFLFQKCCLSSVFLHFQDDCPTQNKLRIKFEKKGLSVFWICFSQDSAGLFWFYL